jgi:hypothetical protein
MEHLEIFYVTGGNANKYMKFGKQFSSFFKVKNRFAI